MNELKDEFSQIQGVYELIVAFLVEYSFQLLGALIVLAIGIFIANRLSNSVRSLCDRKGLDQTLARFVANLVKITVVIMVAVMCLNMIGISITPFVAAIGAASLGAGLAFQGLLSNYGAGLNIIVTRPFVVGDTISVQGVSGQVSDILLAYTVLENEDGVEITIPNKHIIGEILHNSKNLTLVEVGVGVAYGSDLDQVVALLTAAVSAQPYVSESPSPQVGIDEFADSSVNLQVRFWTPTQEMMASRFAMNKVLWDALRQHNIAIPFPQREVLLKQ